MTMQSLSDGMVRALATLCVLVLLGTLASCSSEQDASVGPTSFDEVALEAAQEALLSRYELSPYDASRDPLPRTSSFDELFEPVGLLEFSDSLLFNELSNVQINSRGELVAADMRAEVAYVFHPDGTLKTILDPTQCFPGFSGTPRLVELNDHDGITIMYMGSPLSFQFGAEGECIGPVDVGEWNPSAFSLNGDRLFGFNIERDEWSVWEMVDSTKQVIVSGSEFAKLNNNYFSNTGDLIAIDDSTLGILFRHSPHVWRLSLSDSSLSLMGEVPPDFVETKEDIPPGAVSQDQINEARKRIWEGKSRTWGYYRLAEDLIIVYHTNRGREPFVSSTNSLGLRIMDLTGKTIHADPITMKGYMTQFVAARDGLFFRLLNEYRDEEERLRRNPPLLVYRFVPPSPAS